MIKEEIIFNSVEEVQSFVNQAERWPADVDVSLGSCRGGWEIPFGRFEPWNPQKAERDRSRPAAEVRGKQVEERDTRDSPPADLIPPIAGSGRRRRIICFIMSTIR